MKGIKFGNIHSYDDLNLILSSVKIPPAPVKTNYIDIPYADGSVDLTEALGAVRYGNRECSFTFTAFPSDDWEAKKTEVSNLLNGQRCRIVLDKDPNYYWDGRCSVNDYESDRNLHKIVIGATVAPYKLKHNQTRVFVPFCGKNLFNNALLPEVYGSGCALTTTTTGVRVTKTSGGNFKVTRWLPIPPLIGKTITISTVINTFGGEEPNLRIGYISADGSARVAKVDVKSTGKKTLTIGEDASEYAYIGVWFYITGDEGAYIDYDNIQIEIGNTATEYEPYATTTDAQEVTLTNGRKSVCPTVMCTSDTTLTVDGTDYALGEGTHKVLDFCLTEGETTVTVAASSPVAIIYQEGDL